MNQYFSTHSGIFRNRVGDGVHPLINLFVICRRLFIFFCKRYRCLHLLFRAGRNSGGGVAGGGEVGVATGFVNHREH